MATIIIAGAICISLVFKKIETFFEEKNYRIK